MQRPASVGLCLSKISKCLSGWGLFFFYNSRRCSFLSRHSSQLCLRSSVRVLPSGSKTWLCATKSACFSDLRENARNYVFLVLAHDRRRILHFNVTAHPTAEWTGQQLREAFPFDQPPRYMLRDRDRIFGDDFREQVRDMGICEVLSAPRSPWQRAYVERVIGSIRRECLDHVIVFQQNALRRTLNSYFNYYHRSRTHLSLAKDSPEPRAIQPPEMGSVVALPQVGGLHHRYERRAA